jgi:hypothetical protein
MYRSISIALSAGAMLVAFAAVPQMLPGSPSLSLSGSALAQEQPAKIAATSNSVKVNNYRTRKPAQTTKKGRHSRPSPAAQNERWNDPSEGHSRATSRADHQK